MRVLDIRVVVRAVRLPAEPPESAWTLELGEVDLTADEILHELHKITTLDGKLKYPHPNRLRSTENQHDWGASASFGEYLLEFSSDYGAGVGAAATFAAIQHAFRRISARSTHAPSREPISIDEARQLLRDHLAVNFTTALDQLTEIEYSHDLESEMHKFTFALPSGERFGGTIGSGEGALRCTNVWRRSSVPTPEDVGAETPPAILP
ncbi:hypothetical protein ACWGIU_18635 [Streptomyces sp. NPDC054840]